MNAASRFLCLASHMLFTSIYVLRGDVSISIESMYLYSTIRAALDQVSHHLPPYPTLPTYLPIYLSMTSFPFSLYPHNRLGKKW